jgi:hypothetical protein
MKLTELQQEDWSIVARHDDEESDYHYHKIPSKAIADKVAVALTKDVFDEFYATTGKEYSHRVDTIYHNGDVVTVFEVLPTDEVERESRMGSPTTMWKNLLK